MRQSIEINRSKNLILFLLWLMMLVAYMDRVNISVAGPTLMTELGLSKGQFGLVLGAFSLGYALLQVPGGMLADRFGSKALLVAGLVVWSAFTGLTGLCAGLAELLAIRVCFGMGEGLQNGAQFKLIGAHFSSAERAKASGIFLSALALGPALATPLSTWLITRTGWRAMFACYAVLGVAVAVILYLFLPATRSTSSERKPDQVSAIWTPQLFKLVAAYLLFNIAFWGFLGWTPTYLKEQRHISLTSLGWIGAIPYLAGFLGVLAVGHLGSSVLHFHKRTLLAVCYLCGGGFLAAALAAGSMAWCIAGLSAAAFFLYASFAPFWALSIDTTDPKRQGSLTGTVNFFGQIGGFAAQWAIGMLAGRFHTFTGAITCMAVSALVAGLVAFSLAN